MYIGQDLQVAYPNYTNIDDISGSFNGVTTSFALTVGGVAPVPNPARSNQCIISVGGVLQRPDDTGSEGFRLSGGNIIFSSAPSTGEDFFGVILAGADYVNVGANFPSGTALVPSITFDTDLDTGIYNPAANQLGFVTAGVSRINIDSRGAVNIDNNTLYVDATNNRVGIGTAAPNASLHVAGDAQVNSLNGGPLAGARNRIINGDMRIDQRNAGSAVSISTNGYTVDRWFAFASGGGVFSVQQDASVVPTGFTASLKATVTTADTSLAATDEYGILQFLEGFNVSDLGFGTATASTITVSFWVRSSITGAHGFALKNNGATRTYPSSYTINAANTWEYKSITITGDTTGTWVTSSGKGIEVHFSLGAGSSMKGAANTWAASNFDGATGTVNPIGTNGATFYITGVQLEPGTVATPFERRIIGQELTLCQRYYATTQVKTGAYNTAGAFLRTTVYFPVSTRVAPTLSASVTETGNAGAVTLDTGTTQTCRYLHSVTATGESYTQANVTISAEL